MPATEILPDYFGGPPNNFRRQVEASGARNWRLAVGVLDGANVAEKSVKYL